MKITLNRSILALVAGVLASSHPVLAQEDLPQGSSIEDLAQEIEARTAEFDAEISSLGTVLAELPSDEMASDGCRPEDLLKGELLISRLERLDECITVFIESSINDLGGEEYIAAQADELLETVLAERVELFRRLNTFIGMDGLFQQYMQGQKAKIDAFELEIQSLLDREMDATVQLEAQQIRRQKYQQMLIEMENTRVQLMALTGATSEYLQTLPRGRDEILPELERLREKARDIADQAEARLDDFLENRDNGEAENN